MRSLFLFLLTILLNACWQIAVVTLFAAGCSWLLRGTAAWCRHTVWVAAMVISLCLPIMSALNKIELSPDSKTVVTHSDAEEPFTRPSELPEIEKTQPAASTLYVPSVAPARQPELRVPISVDRNLATLLVALYAAFVLYRGVKLLRAWRRTTAIMRTARPTQVSTLAAAIIAKCQTAIGVKHVSVVCSNSVHLPITAGVFKPLIILPEELLSETDEDILLSAIGHELVHVSRRDYILNLVYEFIYLPLSFHPAAALLRRRIKQTRELCCDELVAGTLLTPELYARSLVRLVGSVPLAGRLAPDTTIGITDADILEVRIMSLLRRPNLSTRRRALLLIAASLLLITPCVAAASFALRFDINGEVPGVSTEQERYREVNEKLQRAREELRRREQELKERVRNNPNLQGTEREAVQRLERELQDAATKLRQEEEAQQSRGEVDRIRQVQEALAKIESKSGDETQMREAQRKLAEMEKLYSKDRMREVQEAVARMEKNRPENEARLRQARAVLAEMEKNRPENEARLREAREQLEQMQKSFPDNEERLRVLREQLAMTDKQHLNTKLQAEYSQSLGRAQEEIARLAQTQAQREKIGEKLELNEQQFKEREQQYREAREKWEAKEREGKAKIKSKEYEKLIRKDVDKHIRKEMEEASRAGRTREQAELTQLATMSMDRAIQIANSQYPGKVLSCSLGRQKDGQVFYRLVIINGEGDKGSATHVWVSATNGQIMKTEHE
jgi:beta-lactamase regulating signal transducer with metallopeptidase domain